MDIQMPVMDGCEASKIIRNMQRRDARSVIIFACTANTFKDDRKRALSSGMNDFLAKPVNVEEMLTKISGTRYNGKR
jgi:CheY-like chemotaxis protein